MVPALEDAATYRHSGVGAAQVRIMSHKVEEDYTKRAEHEKHERTKDQLLQALDKIRAPICVCEIDQTDTKILFANHTWTMLAGDASGQAVCGLSVLQRHACNLYSSPAHFENWSWAYAQQ